MTTFKTNREYLELVGLFTFLGLIFALSMALPFLRHNTDEIPNPDTWIVISGPNESIQRWFNEYYGAVHCNPIP